MEFPNPNFAEFARTCGGYGIRVETPEKMDDVLQKAISSGKPSIIEVMSDPNKMAASTKKVDQ